MTKKDKIEFGDFQTPRELTDKICLFLRGSGVKPASVIEPTCGLGSFVFSALSCFPDVKSGIALDIAPSHIEFLREALRSGNEVRVEVMQADFFDTNWSGLIRSVPKPLLILGNPPWVTNAVIGTIGGNNIPKKNNFQKHRGIDAITGKSNFDISEWMMLRLVEALHGTGGTLAMLCKTTVARKILKHCWKNGLSLASTQIREIDAAEHFEAAVEACLLVCTFGMEEPDFECPVYSSLDSAVPINILGYRDDVLVADVNSFDRLRHLKALRPVEWRSGVKHDCSKVMELTRLGGKFQNGLGETIDLEDEYLFPMLKSSDIANGRGPTRWMLVTQRNIGDDTSVIAKRAEKTWTYLLNHADALDRRTSVIYKNRPRFSMFGLGDYTFAPYKVTISGFYNHLTFRVVGPFQGKPVVLDDTCYFIPFQDQKSADRAAQALNSDMAKEFFETFIFWGSKRPITIEPLRRLDIEKLIKELGVTV